MENDKPWQDNSAQTEVGRKARVNEMNKAFAKQQKEDDAKAEQRTKEMHRLVNKLDFGSHNFKTGTL